MPEEADFEQYVEERRTVERVTLVGPMAASDRVFLSLARAGFRVRRSGPYTTRAMRPRVDDSRFLIEAEREV